MGETTCLNTSLSTVGTGVFYPHSSCAKMLNFYLGAFYTDCVGSRCPCSNETNFFMFANIAKKEGEEDATVFVRGRHKNFHMDIFDHFEKSFKTGNITFQFSTSFLPTSEHLKALRQFYIFTTLCFVFTTRVMVATKAGYTKLECVGGGRIKMDRDAEEMAIYGHSLAFGLADHELAKKMILEDSIYGAFKISCSNEGY